MGVSLVGVAMSPGFSPSRLRVATMYSATGAHSYVATPGLTISVRT